MKMEAVIGIVTMNLVGGDHGDCGGSTALAEGRGRRAPNIGTHPLMSNVHLLTPDFQWRTQKGGLGACAPQTCHAIFEHFQNI